MFLHGGQASLRRDNVAIGCLTLSVLPRFPGRTLDNQYHLQAFRHLYVAAMEWRALRVVDADSHASVPGLDVLVCVYVHICVCYVCVYICVRVYICVYMYVSTGA